MKRAKVWQDLELVEVVWEDAAADLTHEGTLKDSETAKTFGGMVVCRDIGYLIRKNRKEVVLACGLMCEDNAYRHSNTIPAGWVREIVPLTRATPKPPPAGSPTAASKRASGTEGG
ncbi:MAG: hypothetical protein ACT4PE_05490 [Candidatus Eiseniibacteriota bacterium]